MNHRNFSAPVPTSEQNGASSPATSSQEPLGRVSTPEPHLPLRKASAEKLRMRRGGAPHPLAMHPVAVQPREEIRGFEPATTNTTALPFQTRINAVSEKFGHFSPTTGTFAAALRKQSTATASTFSGGPDDASEISRPGTNLSNYQDRPTSPLSPRMERKNSPAGLLRGSRSVSEGLRSLRERLHHGQSGHPEGWSGIHDYPSLPENAAEEIRTSFRSALTSNSSHWDSTVTDRSSYVTGNSSTSEFVQVYPGWPDTNENEDPDFDVDDAIGMYADGFETPSKNSLDIASIRSKRSFDVSQGRNSTSFLRPGTSPLAGAGRDHPHRRSHSASFLETLRSTPSPKEPLPSLDEPLEPPKPRAHVRTSTQIVAGRDIPGNSPALRGNVFPNAAVPRPVEPPASSPGNYPKPAPVPRDRYGFKKVSHHVTLEQYNAWEGPYNEHLERRKAKWIALMRSYGLSTDAHPIPRFPPKSDKVKRYVRKGIPPGWRGAAWFWYAGGPAKLASSQGLYWSIIEQINRGNKLSDNDKEHIERDLYRTFPDNICFKPDPTTTHDMQASAGGGSDQVETPVVRALRRVLQAFAVHNPNIGYCQSLNFIAGLLLLFLDEDEEKTFILLNVVTAEHLPGTHGVALEGANIDIAVLMTSIKETLPLIWTKLDDKPTNSVMGGPAPLPTISLATTAWFMSLFVGTLPIECVLRVWDCLFFEGSKTLFRVALAIFKAGEAQIKAVNDPMEIFQVVQTMPRGMVDANALMECCFKRRNGFGGLSQEVVEKRREEKRTAVREGRSMTEDDKKKPRRSKSKGKFRSKMKT